MSDVFLHLTSIRPAERVDADKVDDHEIALEHPENAGVGVERGDARIDAEEVVGGADEDSVVKPQLFPSPKAPSSAEAIIRHPSTLPQLVPLACCWPPR